MFTFYEPYHNFYLILTRSYKKGYKSMLAIYYFTVSTDLIINLFPF